MVQGLRIPDCDKCVLPVSQNCCLILSTVLMSTWSKSQKAHREILYVEGNKIIVFGNDSMIAENSQGHFFDSFFVILDLAFVLGKKVMG